jgi:three-Cys-motif partner protein
LSTPADASNGTSPSTHPLLLSNVKPLATFIHGTRRRTTLDKKPPRVEYSEHFLGVSMINDRHTFGSEQTERKLDCLRKYLTAFCIALNQKGFSRVYIDAFAGTGSRTSTHASLPLFEGQEATAIEVTTLGSARIAMGLNPGFHSLIFIEQDEEKARALNHYTRLTDTRAQVRQGDANEIVQHICRRHDWQRERIRGVIFLDPYGMEVSWETVEAIAKTEALDCWYFFPLSGPYRNAPKNPERLDQSKIEALNRVFGTPNWRRDWYSSKETQQDLFGSPTSEERAANVDEIESWIRRRLQDVFKGAVLEPLGLYHPNGAPMAALFFCVANPNRQAVKVASEIAGHILRAGISSQKRPR